MMERNWIEPSTSKEYLAATYFDPDMVANGAVVKMRGHSCDVVGDQAVAQLRTVTPEQPFCLLVRFKAPHRS
jgi:hypothetical protein